MIASPLNHCVEAGTAVIGTDIYLIGGRNSGGTATTRITKYDTLLDTYTIVANLPAGYTNCRAAAVGTDIYIYWDKNIYKLDTLTNTLTTVSSGLAWDFISGSIVSYGTDIFYFCGSSLTNGAFKTTAEVALETNHLLISSLTSGHPVALFNQHGIDIKLPVSNVYKGDANNKAKKVEAYYYNNALWNLI